MMKLNFARVFATLLAVLTASISLGGFTSSSIPVLSSSPRSYPSLPGSTSTKTPSTKTPSQQTRQRRVALSSAPRGAGDFILGLSAVGSSGLTPPVKNQLLSSVGGVGPTTDDMQKQNSYRTTLTPAGLLELGQFAKKLTKLSSLSAQDKLAGIYITWGDSTQAGLFERRLAASALERISNHLGLGDSSADAIIFPKLDSVAETSSPSFAASSVDKSAAVQTSSTKLFATAASVDQLPKDDEKRAPADNENMTSPRSVLRSVHLATAGPAAACLSSFKITTAVPYFLTGSSAADLFMSSFPFRPPGQIT